MDVFNTAVCCGIAEVHATSGPANAYFRGETRNPNPTRESEEAFCARAGLFKKAFLIIAQAGKDLGNDYGFALVRVIKDNSLGEVIESDWRVNPNSNLDLKVWVWAIDHAACQKYAKTLAIKAAEAAAIKKGQDIASWHT